MLYAGHTNGTRFGKNVCSLGGASLVRARLSRPLPKELSWGKTTAMTSRCIKVIPKRGGRKDSEEEVVNVETELSSQSPYDPIFKHPGANAGGSEAVTFPVGVIRQC